MYDTYYLLLVMASLVLGLGTQAYINRQYRKYQQVNISSGLSGAQVAQRMLEANGLADVQVRPISGRLTDNYDPRSRVISLSPDVYDGRSVSATAIACHECGHAVQHARAYAPAALRRSLLPVVNLASNAWMFVMLIGFSLGVLELVWLALALFAAVVLFQLVTLPVEFNASSRALEFIALGGYLPEGETRGAAKVLRAAAMTYIAGALVSVLQLLYFLGRARRR
jgi:Zn-dependent membrane protease YugP